MNKSLPLTLLTATVLLAATSAKADVSVGVTFGEPEYPAYAAPGYVVAPAPDWPSYHYDHHRHGHNDYWAHRRYEEHDHGEHAEYRR